ncbi:MAG TPA: hypothetical protein VH796_07855 [Nitrososphaeraceae archaeon]|jgi:phage anti-repressor protein
MSESEPIKDKLASETVERFLANYRWLREHYNELKSIYNNQWVAIDDNKVLDSDSEFRILLDRIMNSYRLQTRAMVFERI